MRGLDGYLTGRVIARATLHRPDLRFPVPKELPELLTGATVSGFRRRGKYMFMRLDRGMSVLIHLGMSGRMLLDGATALHEHLTIETRGRQARRLGRSPPLRGARRDRHRG